MRGKKVDPGFVSEFIQECVTNLGIYSSDDIVKHAKSLIQEIDDEIKMLENKKKKRSKLLDVISAFEKVDKDKGEEAKMLSFFKLQYPKTCKEICDLLKYQVKSIPALSWASFGDNAAEHNFCIKQMIEAKILTKTGDQLFRGERFDEYMTFVLREAQ
jgi:hypothetical protein